MPPGQPEAPIVAVASLDPEAEAPRRNPRVVRIGWLVAALLLVNLATSLYQLPLNRVVESRLCREYYGEHDPSVIGPDGNVNEELCKVDAVQQGLAWIQGVMDTEWIVGDFAMTLPLGFVAERYGRRTVLWLNLAPRLFMLAWAVVVGYWDAWLPTNAIVAGPALSFLGGDCVFNSLTYALAATMTEDPVIRASYFAYLSSVTYVVALMGPALASATMSLLLWLPFFMGIALLLLAIPAIAALPPHEPLPPPRTVRHDDDHVGGDDGEQQPLLASFPVPKDIDPKPNVLRAVSSSFRNLRATISSHPRNFSLLLVSFVLTSLASSDTKLLVQYISKRYKWKFATAGYLLSGKAVVNFVLLTIVVPSLLRWRDHRLDTADRDNMQYARTCLTISIVGALGIALSVNVLLLMPMLLVYAVGSALPIFTLSLLKSPSICPSQEEREGGGRLDAQTHIFSIVMMVKTLGSLLGAPIMAALWVAGIGIGSLGLGLPYLFSAACYLLALLVFSYIVLD